MIVRALTLSLLIAVAAVAAPGPAAAQIAPDQAKGFIQSMGDDAIKILQQPGNTLAQREEKFRTILKEGFAIPLIGKFVMGGFWAKATPEQQQEYLGLFSEWIVKTYAIRFGGYSGEKFNVVDTRINEQDKDVFVGTRIDRPEGRPPVLATWRVRLIEGKPKIVDVQVEGVSMLVTHRSEFSSVGSQGGVNGIISSLKQRIDKLAQSS
ncbi:MAG: ABC transporter substrate-binding protein [Alphaproteobacteria bacterium]|nr:ABC transporter substrate-binding protein [Alphaproteobacteria bacterium]